MRPELTTFKSKQKHKMCFLIICWHLTVLTFLHAETKCEFLFRFLAHLVTITNLILTEQISFDTLCAASFPSKRWRRVPKSQLAMISWNGNARMNKYKKKGRKSSSASLHVVEWSKTKTTYRKLGLEIKTNINNFRFFSNFLFDSI